ncbi:MAG: hypothetical protein IT383_29305 [Deltaproteobacteria bacterium]|nr:hypothetical protein [Deltaproteobacteria bacterium]
MIPLSERGGITGFESPRVCYTGDVIAALLAWSLVAAASAADMSIPPPAGLEAKLLADAADGELQHLSLLDASMIASGVDDDNVAREAKRAREALQPAIARARTQRNGAARGAVLLRALHDTVLREYQLTATEVDDVIHTGQFNCLSSALLFVVAAEGLLEQPRAMVTRYHAFARVTVDGKVTDVETTTPQGFAADRATLMTVDYVSKIAGSDTSPAELLADLKHPEELPALSLIAALYSNRAVGLVQRGDLRGAAVALDRAHRLAAGAFRERLSAWRGGVLNTGAVTLVDEGRLADARALLELALEGTRGDTRKLLSTNLQNVRLRQADDAMARNDWTAALAHIDAAARAGAPASELGDLRARANAQLAALEGSDARCTKEQTTGGRDGASAAAICFAAMSRARREQGAVDDALQLARRAHALAPSSAEVESAVFFALAEKIKRARAADSCDVVEALVREAQPFERALQGQPWPHAEIVGGCLAHAAEAAFKTHEWTRAGALLQRAASRLPDDATIRANLARVDANQALEHARQGACDRARPLAHRAAAGDPAVLASMTSTLEHCAHLEAERAAARGDWAAAATLARRGLLDAPSSASLRENVGVYLHNQAVVLLKAKRCDEARTLVPELRAAGRAIADDVDQCR